MRESPARPNLIRRILRTATRPSTLAVGGGLVAIGVVGYTAGKAFVKENIPNWVEPLLTQTLKREVTIGEVQSLSLNHIELGPVNIPPTPTDPDRVSLQKIEVDFNLLPLLFKRTLPAQVKLTEINGYVEQDAQGNWVDLQLEKGGDPPPINLDLKVEINDAALSLLPYEKTTPVIIKAEGNAAYLKKETEQVNYDINATLGSGKIKAQGETNLKTWKTAALVNIQELGINDVVSLLPNPPVIINDGKLNANLDVEVVSYEELTSTNIEGGVSLLGVEGKVEELSLPVKARALLRFAGEDVLVEEVTAQLGEIVTTAQGLINWEKGYQLEGKVEPFSLKNALEIVQPSLPVEVEGKMQLKMQVSGPIKDPLLTGKLESITPVGVDRVSFQEIKGFFRGDLSQVVLENATAAFTAGGAVTAQGKVDLNLQESLAKNLPIDVMNLPLNFEFQGEVPVGKIAAEYGIKADTPSKLTTRGKVGGTLANIQGNLDWEIPRIILAGESFSGDGQVLLNDKNLILNDTQLRTATGEINVEGSSNIASQNWQVAVDGKDFPLDPILAQIQLPQLAIPHNVDLENARIRLTGNTYALAPEKIMGVANLGLNVAEGTVLVNSKLNQGIVNAEATANKIPISEIVTTLPVPVGLVGSRVNLTANLADLLALQSSQDLSQVNVTADALLTTAAGTVNVTGNLNNNQLQSEITAENLAAAQLVNPLFGEEKLRANVRLSGDVSNLERVPIQVEQIVGELGEQKLLGNGTVLLTELLTQPEIENVNLDVEVAANLGSLPLEELMAVLPIEEKELLPKELKLTGLANFQGRLAGGKLLSDPLAPGNLLLTGNLNLRDLNLNEVGFEPLLAGTVKVAPGEEMGVELRGEKDAIVAKIEPCTRNDCLAPYLPRKIELRKTQGEEIIVLGEREGDRFLVDVQNFPLSILGLAPASEFGITGIVKGNVLANVAVDLFNLQGKGDLTVTQPGLGEIQADEIQANFSLTDELAEVTSAQLTFGSSKYLVNNASFNRQTEEIGGELNFAGNVKDIINATNLYNVERIAALFSQEKYATSSAEVQSESVGKPNAPLGEQINLGFAISEKISQAATTIAAGKIPTELDIEGEYTGKIDVGGSLENPQANLIVEGQNWQWLPNPSYRDIVEPLGLVTAKTGVVSINEVKLGGNLNGNVVQIEPALIRLGETTVLSLAGQVSPTKATGEFKVENFTLDLVENFIALPLDAEANINVAGNLTGTPQNPVVAGDVTLEDIALNGKAIESNIVSNFKYAEEKLHFATTEPEYIQVEANVPLPQGGEERATVNVNLGTEAIALIGVLTQGQLELVEGAGEVVVAASIPVTDPTNLEKVELDTEITLENATIKSAALENNLQVTGKILADEKLLQVEEITGTLANSNLLVSGALPLFEPSLNPSNPLTLAIENQQINLTGLYRGNIDGEVIIKGAALAPIIGGEVTLARGQIFVPEGNSNTEDSTNNNQPAPPLVVPKLKDFQINLNQLNISQWPLYRFSFGGNLTANGSILDLKNLQSNGVIVLDRGQITFLNTRFDLNRLHDNTIKFIPAEGTMNPSLDLQLETIVSEVSEAGVIRGSSDNETPDPLSRIGNSDSIRVTLGIDGQADRLLPFLGKQALDLCTIRADQGKIIPEPPNLSPAELQQFGECIQLGALQTKEGTNNQLLNSSIVSLSSSPPRSQGEIVNLLATGIADQLQGLTSGEIAEGGFVQFAVEYVAQPLFINRVNEQSRKVGRGIGLSDLRVFPTLDGVYRLEENTFINISYDYAFSEFKVRYQRRF
ncbi:MAG: translocation/assembly module TamB domain-containing protein [Gomphosphaeria aponina SAG 52.96 = DSM 107014]|uniref:Translocation/assembly module TamB domain-containing protein n=1 Tax=Gomphosphaeria aponina SAG 52.96 = DSM 107014 TaxID=1521640 RepID=A0A941JNQ1_9CHRO|nr:translocation/assembly module TamB domain-containing protein [Gomphosphaeria aponina SAG 52.96 = DSM 107014]